jgi:hypothetical protein
LSGFTSVAVRSIVGGRRRDVLSGSLVMLSPKRRLRINWPVRIAATA